MSKHKIKQWKKRLIEIRNKDLIDDDQLSSLTDMLASEDKSNFVVAEEAIKTLIRNKLSTGLNNDQTLSFENIVNHLEDPQHDAIILKGYAGTGKTFLVKRIIEYIIYSTDDDKIAIGAPTNKAVSVLYNNSMISGMNGYIFEDIFSMDSRITYSTIHKLLGLKEIITDDGQQLFEVDSINNSRLSDYKYLIVDEISMLDDKICHDIMKFSGKLKIIFMGDPAQIPPVNRTDSIPFKSNHKYNFTTTELKEIMRQKGDHPIIEMSFKIRENLMKPQPLPVLSTKLNSEHKGIIFMNSLTEKINIKPLLEKYFKCDAFKEDGDYMKVIAWKNKTVDYINNVVREIIYGKKVLPRFIVGEYLIAVKPIFEERKDEHDFSGYKKWSIVMNTSEEMLVKNIDIHYVNFYDGPYRMRAKCYSLTVHSYDPSDPQYPNITNINVIHEHSLADYNKILDEAKKFALKTRNASNWVRYFNIVKWNANVSYNYAITAHKSQGSTYKNVLILEDDVDQNRKTLERNRIKYTAYSRATDLLYVLRLNYPELTY